LGLKHVVVNEIEIKKKHSVEIDGTFKNCSVLTTLSFVFLFPHSDHKHVIGSVFDASLEI
jgi:hypothetical protein